MIEIQRLGEAGTDPLSPEAQHLVAQHNRLILQYKIPERALRQLAWNSPVTIKWMGIGAKARHRYSQSTSRLGSAIVLSGASHEFFVAAHKGSSRRKVLEQIVLDVNTLMQPAAPLVVPALDEPVRRFREACLEHLFEDPYTFAR